MTVIPIVIGALSTVIKVILQGLDDLEMRGRVEIFQTRALLRTARILRRILEACCHSDSSRKLPANTVMKNFQMSFKKIIILIIFLFT